MILEKPWAIQAEDYHQEIHALEAPREAAARAREESRKALERQIEDDPSYQQMDATEREAVFVQYFHGPYLGEDWPNTPSFALPETAQRARWLRLALPWDTLCPECRERAQKEARWEGSYRQKNGCHCQRCWESWNQEQFFAGQSYAHLLTEQSNYPKVMAPSGGWSYWHGVERGLTGGRSKDPRVQAFTEGYVKAANARWERMKR